MADTASTSTEQGRRFLLAFGTGALVAVGLGVYGNVHDPTGKTIFTLFFTATLNLKAWFATIAALLALFQLYSALRMYGRVKIPTTMPTWLPRVHRLTGTAAFAFTLPVAFHCLWSLGFQDIGTRQLVHSLAGCFFYGAFVTKIIVYKSKAMPGWALPVAGGALFTAIIIVWLTSALWFFQNVGFPAF